MIRIGLLLLLSLSTLSIKAQSVARGQVYEDLNGNVRLDPGEPGVAGVRVSNGLDVVRTGTNGEYALPVADEAIVFLVKPAGYATPVDSHMLPQFYYIHQPAGSPAPLRYLGIEPTGPLPLSIDFPLRRQQEPNRFEAVLFSDTQPQTSVELDFIRDDVVAELIGTNARFGMTMGDIMFDDMSLLPRYNAIIAQLGIPWYNVPGNHELNLLAPDDRYSLETFKSFYGPPYYSFEYGQAYFVILDNIEYKGNGQSDPGDYRGNGGYEARFGEQQLRWLANDLEHVPQDKLVFLSMHSPLKTYTGDRPNSNTQDRRDLFRLLAGRPNLYAVAGHTHTTEHHYFGPEDGFQGPGEFHHHVLATVSGSWWSGPLDERGIAVAEQVDGTPNGYHLLEVDGTSLEVRYKAAGKPSDFQMRILFDVAHHHHEKAATRDFRFDELLDGSLSEDEVAATAIVVNLFDGGPKSKVTFQMGGRPPREMERRLTFDPHTNELFKRHADTKKGWVNAVPSSHVFVADLPDDLQPGTYTVTVRAIDEFGRSHHAHRILEITGSSAVKPKGAKYP